MTSNGARVAVIGAGASGIVAAITAARCGSSVTLFERDTRAGRSIMASGNGRCNFSNCDLDPSKYNDPSFVSKVMGDDPLSGILNFFEGIGLWYSPDDEGRLYPRSRAAASVLDVLMHAVRDQGVRVRLQTEVTGVFEQPGCIEVQDSTGLSETYDSVVWAAGGGSAQIPECCLGLDATTELPVLCPLATSPRPGKDLDGVRAVCEVTLLDGTHRITTAMGEVLWRPYGLSGIVIFDMSRLCEPGDILSCDLVPNIDETRLVSILKKRADAFASNAGRTIEEFLDGTVHPKLARNIVRMSIDRSGRVDTTRVASHLKHLTYTITGPTEISHAQVTRGGLANNQFDPSSLRCPSHPRFHACGEVLDVDAQCGGYNLSWAWASGMVAGASASQTC